MEVSDMTNAFLKVFLISLLEVVKKANDLQEVVKHLETLIKAL